MRPSQLALGCIVAAFLLAAQACVGDPAASTGTPTSDGGEDADATSAVADAGAVADASADAGNQQDANDAGPELKCRVDQLICDKACVDISPQHCGACTTV